MRHRRVVSLVGPILLVALGCGPRPGSGPGTVAEVEVLRPGLRVGGQPVGSVLRVADGAEIAVGEGGRAWLRHDAAARLLLDGGAKLTVLPDGARLDAGRVFVDAAAGARIRIAGPAATVDGAGAAFEAARVGEALHVTVARGEVTWHLGEKSGQVRAGESADLATGGATVKPEALWDDWTGGLAWPDPGHAARARSLGEIGARRPGSLGEARFPLAVTRLEVRARVVDDLATTQVIETFFNPASDTLEGLYRVRIPEGAILERFAIDRDGRWADGYVKERQAARAQYQAQVYEGSTHDPALLEWETVGSFRARIYPIPAGATRRVLLEYSEWLTPHGDGGHERTWRFPMAGGEGGPVIEELDVELDTARAGATSLRAGLGARIAPTKVVLERTDFRPRADLVVDLVGEKRPIETARAWRGPHRLKARDLPRQGPEDDYWLALPVPLPLEAQEKRSPLDLVIVTDVSAATDATHLQLARTVAEALLRHLDEQDRVALIGADLGLHVLPVGALPATSKPALAPAARATVDRMLDALARQGTGGATDLGATITQAAALLEPGRRGAVIYIGDAFPTVGELNLKALRERLDRLPAPLRLYGVGIGDDADLALLSGLAADGGLALRVGDRAAAADAALRLLGHASLRAAFRVKVDVGAGVDRVYPRAATTVVEGEALPIVARVRTGVPTQVTITGLIDGKPFSLQRKLTTTSMADSDDLRLRWASARLARLLAEGGSAEEVAELGTRQNLITPFTSFYVPSADELARLDPLPPASRGVAIALLGLGALGPFGCSRSENAPPSSVEVADNLQVAKETSRHRGEEGKMGKRQVGSGLYALKGPPRPVTVAAPSGSSAPATAAAPPPPPAAPMMEKSEEAENAPMAPKEDVGGADEGARLNSLMGAQGAGGGGSFGASTGSIGSIGGLRGGEDKKAMAEKPSSHADAPARARMAREVASSGLLKILGAKGNKDATIDVLDGDDGRAFDQLAERGRRPDAQNLYAAVDDRTVIRIHIGITAHRPRHCSAASRLDLGDRLSLWNERLDRHPGEGGAMEVWQDAGSTCELKMWSDRRALLGAMLSHSGGAPRMVALYHRFDASPAEQDFLRRAVLGRVRTAADLRVVYDGLGLSEDVRWTLVEEVLAKARTDGERVVGLEQLMQKWPQDLRLKLKMIEALEAASRIDDARRIADEVRRSPSPDAQARTLVGEFLVRQGDEGAARRAFSEIVEFSPRDPLARRRLGDLYRAHGWFEEAYRQYQTLAELSPGDQSVLLLQAMAAAGAGRTDEGLRLAERVAAGTEPGGESGIARVALWWSSLRQSLLREKSRGDAAELARLMGRARRTGVLREARPLRVYLTWAHPEADCELSLQLPGAPLAPASSVAPEFGLASEASLDPLVGPARIVVKRTSPSAALRYEAAVTVVLDEGGKGERVAVVPLQFAPGVTGFELAVDHVTGKVAVIR
ncbi:MAG: hypothetical protein EXR72_00360 [Myxococcales bacterium]|nr:hypothetical protein [Myxococcales bacterium]